LDLFAHRWGKTSVRPLNKPRNNATFCGFDRDDSIGVALTGMGSGGNRQIGYLNMSLCAAPLVGCVVAKQSQRRKGSLPN
jgi:hypothetical protein